MGEVNRGFSYILLLLSIEVIIMMEEKIFEIIARVLNVSVDMIDGDVEIGELAEWDSLHHVAIIAELEKVFNIKFDAEDLQELEDVSDIISLVKSQLS